MKHTDFDNIDDFIDSALKTERMRSVPFGFHRMVDSNLRVAAQIQVERNRYRMCMLVGVAAYTLAFGSATLYMVLGAIYSSLYETLPGFLMYYTQMLHTAEVWWVEIIAFTGLMTGIGIWTLLHLNSTTGEKVEN
ncbi:MAG: hypothetical protein VCD00_18270 [Candidatus Hydrogenedentota bacterium]